MAEENLKKGFVLKVYKRAVEKIFETDNRGKREIDKIINVASGTSKKNLKQLKSQYDKNPKAFLKEHWSSQLASMFYSHDLLRDIIAMMITIESEVLEDERTQKSDA